MAHGVAARRTGEKFDRLAYATHETVILSPLLCWNHLSPEVQKRRVTELVAWIEAEAAERRARTGSQPFGASAVRGQHPHDCPRRLKRSPAPLFHAFQASASRALRRLCLVRSRLQRGLSKSAVRGPFGALPRWQLPAGIALRRRIARKAGVRLQQWLDPAAILGRPRWRCAQRSRSFSRN
jgi:hypothetical protein